MSNTTYISSLIIRHLQDDLTTEESQALTAWMEINDTNRELFHQLTDPTFLQQELTSYSETNQRIQQMVYDRLQQQDQDDSIPLYTKSRGWLRWSVAAAAILMVAFVGTWYLTRKLTPAPVAIVQQNPKPLPILPGGNKATLTLGDGSVVNLDSTANGLVSNQGNVKVVKSNNGLLTYESANTKQATAIPYNILSTPRGGQYQLLLPDGSKVWLNAASSIKYPAAFTGNERSIAITGEAYFEVAKAFDRRGNRIPFAVTIPPSTGGVGGGHIEVLGTHFNVNAYGDEHPVVATLLEGKISIDNKQLAIGKEQSTVITPGQQAVINEHQEIKVKDKADIESATAWMKGFFDMHNADIKKVMLQVSRWYNVDVVYAGPVPHQTFDGNIDCNIPLADLLALLQQMGHFNVQIEGRTITIKQ